MWFVWDGQTRIGPISEHEICRRVAAGEWPLVVFVRPDDSAVYRPLLWMLPKWTAAAIETERTLVRGREPMREATQIAPSVFLESLPTRNSAGDVPVQHPVVPLPAVQMPRSEIVPDETAEQKILFADSSSFSQTLATQLSLQPRMRESAFDHVPSEISVIRTDSVAIDGGERQSSEREKPKSGGGTQGIELSQPLKLAGKKKSLHLSVQSPAHASEGVVSLVDHESATQIKFRRLNPTAPRKRGRPNSRRFADKGPVNSLRKILDSGNNNSRFLFSPLFLSLVALVVVMIVVTGVIIYDKRQRLREVRAENSQQVALSEQGQQVISSDIVKPQASSSVQDKRKKKLNARSLDRSESRISSKGPKVFDNFSELSRYLSSSVQRGFIVVGPIKLQTRPMAGCSPCRINGRLPDGSLINLVSFSAQPWQSVAGTNVVYAKGFLTENENGRLNLTVNTLNEKPF